MKGTEKASDVGESESVTDAEEPDLEEPDTSNGDDPDVEGSERESCRSPGRDPGRDLGGEPGGDSGGEPTGHGASLRWRVNRTDESPDVEESDEFESDEKPCGYRLKD